MTRAAKPARVGVFGGTFNPIHLGHLRAAEEISETLDLDRMLFVPSAVPPHKSAGDDDVIAPADLRLEWVRLAIEGNPRFQADPLEIERDGPSYSVQTLEEIGARLAPERPVFVIGDDAFVEIDSWREPARLFELAHFVVITRPPVEHGSLETLLPNCVRDRIELEADGLSGRHRGEGTWIRLVPTTPLDVSSSEIRARLREGRSVRYLLPKRVHDAVVASGVYGAAMTDR